MQNGRETPRKYPINWQEPYVTNLELRYAPTPIPTLNGDHLSDMTSKRCPLEVGEREMLYTLCIFHIEGVVSQLVLHGIVVLGYLAESGDAGYISANHRHLTANPPLADWCPTYRPLTDHWPTGARCTNR